MSTKTQQRTFPTREDVLAADDRATETIEVPEWGGWFTVKELSGTERDRYMGSLYTMRSDGKGGMEVASVNVEGASARLVALSVIAPDSSKMFSDKDVAALGDKGSAAIDRVYQVASRLSRLTLSTEALVADLKATQNGSSGTA